MKPILKKYIQKGCYLLSRVWVFILRFWPRKKQHWSASTWLLGERGVSYISVQLQPGSPYMRATNINEFILSTNARIHTGDVLTYLWAQEVHNPNYKLANFKCTAYIYRIQRKEGRVYFRAIRFRKELLKDE